MLPIILKIIILTAMLPLHTSLERFELQDYDYNILRTIRKKDIREKLLKKRIKENIKKNKPLNATLSKNVVYFDNVLHFEVKEKSEFGKKVAKIEKNFKKMLSMRGVTYMYKRDSSWRTWREVKFEKTRVIHYKCSGAYNQTCRDCKRGGYWIIEDDPPPCPYEIFTMIDKDRLCGSTFNYNSNKSCPSVIQFSDLSRACDNPIITDYKVKRVFNMTATNGICAGEDYCEISTVYRMYQDYILFRITNSSNHVIFSKIIKIGKNYACITDCGLKNDKYMKSDLLTTKKKETKKKKVTKKKPKNTKERPGHIFRKNNILKNVTRTKKYFSVEGRLRTGDIG